VVQYTPITVEPLTTPSALSLGDRPRTRDRRKCPINSPRLPTRSSVFPTRLATTISMAGCKSAACISPPIGRPLSDCRLHERSRRAALAAASWPHNTAREHHLHWPGILSPMPAGVPGAFRLFGQSFGRIKEPHAHEPEPAARGELRAAPPFSQLGRLLLGCAGALLAEIALFIAVTRRLPMSALDGWFFSAPGRHWAYGVWKRAASRIWPAICGRLPGRCTHRLVGDGNQASRDFLSTPGQAYQDGMAFCNSTLACPWP